MILVVDNFDSFTYNLVDYLSQLDFEVEVRRNNEPLELLCNEKYDGIVLSPGPGTPENAGHLMKVVEYYHDKKPVLGICLGHQAIAQYFGAKIVKAPQPMHGKISEISHNQEALFDGIRDSFNVTRYHSLLSESLPSCLTATAKSSINEIMAVAHMTLPIHGLQFHPEAVLSENGLQLLKNWKNINSLTN